MNLKAVIILVSLCATQVISHDLATSKWIWSDDLDSDGLASPGSSGFIQELVPVHGKVPKSCDIVIAADKGYDLFVNGAPLSSGNWTHGKAHHLSTLLLPGRNVFAVNVTNNATEPANAGLITSIVVNYVDGTNDTITSNATWRANKDCPPGFEKPGFDYSGWPPATIVGNYGASPWGSLQVPASPQYISPPYTININFPQLPGVVVTPSVSFPIPPSVVSSVVTSSITFSSSTPTTVTVPAVVPNSTSVSLQTSSVVTSVVTISPMISSSSVPVAPPAPTSTCAGPVPAAPTPDSHCSTNPYLTLDNAYWVWTNETTVGPYAGIQSNTNAPVGSRAFRKVVNLGSDVAYIDSIMIVDNSYYLYVQGTYAATGASYTVANHWNITLTKPSSTITFGVNGYNGGGPAGLLGAFEFHFVDSSKPPVRMFTDGTWRFNGTVPTGFEKTTYDDCFWPYVTVEGKHGSPWWGGIQWSITPTAVSV